MKMRKSLSVLLALLIVVSLFASCQNQKKNDIIILYTNDVHCSIDENIGYSGLAAYKKSVEAKTDYVSLVDCGDAIQGSFVGTISEGEYITEIMNEVGYDFAVLGNHEFDYGMQRLSSLIGESTAQYLSCNITYTGDGENPLSQIKPYQIETYGNKKVAFIGVTTPQSLTTSSPASFVESGETVYDFASGNDGTDLYNCVQQYVDECSNAGADYIVLLSHLGDDDELSPYSSVDVIENTTGVDAVLDGHSHSTISCDVEQNKNGEDVLLSSTGTTLENIGQLVITKSGNISTGLISDYSRKDGETDSFISSIKSQYDEKMKETVASSDISLSGYDENGIRLVRNRETTIGDFCADAYRAVSGADIAFVNGGGIRADLPSGNITYADMLAVHPYGNKLCVVKATGQEILDCLEKASMNTKSTAEKDGNANGENGGFEQVSGLKYTIDTSIESSVKVDDKGMFVSVDGARRVKDVQVLQNGKYVPIEAEKIYTVASHNYLIKSGGDGLNMFADNELIMDEGMLDYQVLITYITNDLQGQLSGKYSAVDNRITVV